MKFLIIAGFLGSGKTTLLLALARKLTAFFEKIAIIENEVGEIGIDGSYLRKEGLEVQEIFSGCVCCTLKVDLILTLQRIERLFNPNLVVLEASGVARPGDIVDTLRSHAPMVKSIVVVTLVDATRHDMLMEMMTPLITAQIEAADIVAINKIDGTNGAEIDRIQKSMGRLNGQAAIVPVSAERQVNLESLLRALQ